MIGEIIFILLTIFVTIAVIKMEVWVPKLIDWFDNLINKE